MGGVGLSALGSARGQGDPGRKSSDSPEFVQVVTGPAGPCPGAHLRLCTSIPCPSPDSAGSLCRGDHLLNMALAMHSWVLPSAHLATRLLTLYPPTRGGAGQARAGAGAQSVWVQALTGSQVPGGIRERTGAETATDLPPGQVGGPETIPRAQDPTSACVPHKTPPRASLAAPHRPTVAPNSI